MFALKIGHLMFRPKLNTPGFFAGADLLVHVHGRCSGHAGRGSRCCVGFKLLDTLKLSVQAAQHLPGEFLDDSWAKMLRYQ